MLRQTFAALLDAAAASHAQAAALEARLAQQEARRREEGEARAVEMRTIRTLMDSHVEALRAEFAPRLKGLEARCAELLAAERASSSGGGSSSSKRQQLEEARMVEAALLRRVELLQGEVVRLARALDGKADGAEVEAALRLRVSKASLPKRLEAILLHGGSGEGAGGGQQQQLAATAGGGPAPLLAGLRRCVEAVKEKQAEQERIVRRLGREMEAVRTHVVGGGGGSKGKGEEGQQREGLAGVLRGLQTVLEQQGKRLQRAEKEVAGLREKVVRELAFVEGRVAERARGGGGGGGGGAGGGPVVVAEESFKAFEREIVKVRGHQVRVGDGSCLICIKTQESWAWQGLVRSSIISSHSCLLPTDANPTLTY